MMEIDWEGMSEKLADENIRLRELCKEMIDSMSSSPDMGGKHRYNCTPKTWPIIRQVNTMLKSADLAEHQDSIGDLHDADPGCWHELDENYTNGTRCIKCGGWFCF